MRVQPESGIGATRGAPAPSREAPALTLRFADCELDFARHELRRAGVLVDLQPTPLRVLLYLAEQRGRTVSRQELFDEVWPDVVVGDDALTRALMEVRRGVGDDVDVQRVVRTLKGLGYRFVAEVEVVGGESEPPTSDADTPKSRFSARARIASASVALALAAITAWLWWPPPLPPARVPFGVLVLPVANVAGDEESRALADGLTEQITHAISANGYPVVSRTTAAQWKERAADVRALGRELGVSHVLEGGVQRDEGRARVTVQLVATNTGLNVWSEKFEHAGGDRFAFQDQVTMRVGVRVYHSVWGDIAAMEQDPELAEIARLTLEARKLHLEDRNLEFLEVNDRLLAVTPNRAPFLELRSIHHALAGYAWANLYAWDTGGTRSFDEAAPRFMAHAQASVAASPKSALAHSVLARAHAHHWKWREAEREVQRTCDLAPNGFECSAIVPHVCLALGCLDRALEVVDAWRRAQPVEYGGWVYLAWTMLAAGRFEESEQASLRARELFEGAAAYLPFAQWQLGKRDEAIESWGRMLAAREGGAATAHQLERIRAAEGPEAALRWIAAQQAGSNPHLRLSANQNDFQSGLTLAWLGEFEASLLALERSIAEREPGMELFSVHPAFDPIRDTPRFRALIEKMGLTPYHEKYGVFERARQRVAARRAELAP